MKRPHAHRSRARILLLIGMALAVHTLLPQVASLEELGGAIRRLQWWIPALAIVSQAASYWGFAYTMQSTARLIGERLSIGGAMKLALASSSVGLVAGGAIGSTAAAHHWGRGLGLSDEGAWLCGWLPKILNAAVLVAFAAAGTIGLARHHSLGGQSGVSAIVVAGGLLVAGLLTLAWVSRSDRRLARLLAALQRRWMAIRRQPTDEEAIADSARRVVSARRLFWAGGWRHTVLGALANTGFDIVTLYCLFVAAGDAVSPGVLLAGYGVPLLVGRGTFLPGGLGVVETGMVGLYTAVGVPNATAVIVVLLYRVLSFWLPTIVGFLIAPALQRQVRR
jgi:glycosyltransferase 2 family protein